MIEQADLVLHHFQAICLGLMRLVATTVPAVVDRNYLVVVHEGPNDGSPLHLNVRGKAVNQQDRLAHTLHLVVNLDAIGIKIGILNGVGAAKESDNQQPQERRSAAEHVKKVLSSTGSGWSFYCSEPPGFAIAPHGREVSAPASLARATDRETDKRDHPQGGEHGGCRFRNRNLGAERLSNDCLEASLIVGPNGGVEIGQIEFRRPGWNDDLLGQPSSAAGQPIANEEDLSQTRNNDAGVIDRSMGRRRPDRGTEKNSDQSLCGRSVNPLMPPIDPPEMLAPPSAEIADRAAANGACAVIDTTEGDDADRSEAEMQTNQRRQARIRRDGSDPNRAYWPDRPETGSPWRRSIQCWRGTVARTGATRAGLKEGLYDSTGPRARSQYQNRNLHESCLST